MALQLWPFPLFGAQAPLRQSPLVQSASAAQVEGLQALTEAHTTPPGQAAAPGAAQAPAPLQLPAAVSCPPLHAGVPQPTVGTANRQAPFPSQVPSWPQAVASAVQAPADEPPVATGLQAPVPQVMQRPEQAVAQQTPEIQFAWVHWSLLVQVEPSGSVVAQVRPAVQ